MPTAAPGLALRSAPLVHQLGGYRFRDVLRAGLPLKIVVGVIALAMIGCWVPMA
jgi:di/tricarboxylate transporter